ncbi:hypothetical protein [Paludisphaera soli]|uniref:hypothetical protein n=1 Tax=Paludisphaera soli TaxID=2712865 RepID=UPI0013EC6A12|nr:hypothetical protein [Paludisphaera soli]
MGATPIHTEASTSTIDVAPPSTARDVFLTWEKWLRPAFNVILAGVAGLVLLNFSATSHPLPMNVRTYFHFASWAVAANLLFTAGPLADLYLAVLLGRRSVVATGVLFTFGTLLSMMLVPISLNWLWAMEHPGLGAVD